MIKADHARFNCVLVGDESLTIRCGQYLLDAGHYIVLVVTKAPNVVDWATGNGLALVDSFDAACETLKNEPFDYLFSVANLKIIPEKLLEQAKKAGINFHDGPLPTYVGRNVTSWAIINGEKSHAVTWHSMTGRVDNGLILKQAVFDIDEEETAFTLNTKCFLTGFDSFRELVSDIETESLVSTPLQPTARTVYLSRKRPANGAVLDWDSNAASLSALFRACILGPRSSDYANLFALPKCVIGTDLLIVRDLDVLETVSDDDPGTILGLENDQLTISTQTNDVALGGLVSLEGNSQDISSLLSEHRLGIGKSLHGYESYRSDRVCELYEEVAAQEVFWVGRLANRGSLRLPYEKINRRDSDTNDVAEIISALPEDFRTAVLSDFGCLSSVELTIAVICLFFSRLSGQVCFSVDVRPPSLVPFRTTLRALVASSVPLQVEAEQGNSVESVLRSIAEEIRTVSDRATYCPDVYLRYPQLRAQNRGDEVPAHSVLISWCSEDELDVDDSVFALKISIDEAGTHCRWIFNTDRYDKHQIEGMSAMLNEIYKNVLSDSNQPAGTLALLDSAGSDKLLIEWNQTVCAFPKDTCIHHLFEKQVVQTPGKTAILFREEQLSYEDVNERANQLAHYLIRIGVAQETLVGVLTDRSIEMLISVMAVLKAGGAYVPLDPDFPSERLSFMLKDAGIRVILTQQAHVSRISAQDATIVTLDEEWDVIEKENPANPQTECGADNLAYVIYTSGSTGSPRGVMVEHRNVVNFFTGMDAVVDRNDASVWLAVTSLSFDISVLELLWTLSSGFKVVLYDPNDELTTSNSRSNGTFSSRPIEFSLFYFASDEGGEGAADKYKLLLEGSQFADENGFAAVWTPERHFHAFGGLYPNPSVSSAAIAAITERIAIRAGSCVSPLHSPIRIAEEWSVVDNLSKGRVGIAFASGWQPNDFVLLPDNFSERKSIMFQQIEEVKQLWRGEAVTYKDGNGTPIEVRTLPRPVQEELPVWVTAAGNPDTFRMAGEKGYNILTHLLGQTHESLSDHISIYRTARREAGYDPDAGKVTLMLHTYVGDEDDAVRELVRDPMKDYLLSSVGLVKLAAEVPLFKQNVTGRDVANTIDHFSDQDMDEVLDFSFVRYFDTSGLFGTEETCLQTVDRLKLIGVDEIACLVDFGLPADTVLSQMPALAKLMQRANKVSDSQEESHYTLKNLIQRHQVTHLQCTPSMATMLVADPATFESIQPLEHLMIGGEAFPPSLASTLRSNLSGSITNMYGPTETTIWSTTHPVRDVGRSVPIGRPVANTMLYVLDEYLQPVPAGLPGELYIGGEGVARGYLGSPDVTQERFLRDKFSTEAEARMYKTGDLVRYQDNGDLEFLGRLDHQVKIRGYRIELGEIEYALARHPGIREAVVVVREDVPGDGRLYGYVINDDASQPSDEELRNHLGKSLPDYMIPSRFVRMHSFPQTPNRKVDRKALPRDSFVQNPLAAGKAPNGATEKMLAEIWMKVLDSPTVGTDDNFFSLGGNSILAMTLVSEIRQTFDVDLPLVSLFQAPTIAGLAEIIHQHQIEGASEEHLREALADIEDLSEDGIRNLLKG